MCSSFSSVIFWAVAAMRAELSIHFGVTFESRPPAWTSTIATTLWHDCRTAVAHEIAPERELRRALLGLKQKLFQRDHLIWNCWSYGSGPVIVNSVRAAIDNHDSLESNSDGKRRTTFSIKNASAPDQH